MAKDVFDSISPTQWADTVMFGRDNSAAVFGKVPEKDILPPEPAACLASTYACMMTVAGRPTTAREVDGHTKRPRGQYHLTMDTLRIKDFVATSGIKQHDIIPSSHKKHSLERFFKRGNELDYDDYVQFITDLYSTFSRTGEQLIKMACRGPEEYKREMELRRKVHGRSSEEYGVTEAKVRRHLQNGPVMVHTGEADNVINNLVLIKAPDAKGGIYFFDSQGKGLSRGDPIPLPKMLKWVNLGLGVTALSK